MKAKQVTIPLYLLLLLSLLTISCTTLPGSKGKKAKSLFPEGTESITLLSATISPDTITTDGAELRINFTNNDSISTTNLIPVIVFVANKMTIKEYSTSEPNINSDYIIIDVSNPSSYSASGYGKGMLSGSGTIYVYLEEDSDIPLGDKNRNDKVNRVSNILSVYATFK